MSPVRKLVSPLPLLRPLFVAALAAMALTGCYDLSDPTGPRREDFARDRAATQPQTDSETKADAVCASEPCPIVERRSALPLELELGEGTADEDRASDATRRKIMIAAPGAP